MKVAFVSIAFFLLSFIIIAVFDIGSAQPAPVDDNHWIDLVTNNDFGNEKIMQAVNVLCNPKRPESDVIKCYKIITNGNTPEIEFHTACAIAGWYY